MTDANEPALRNDMEPRLVEEFEGSSGGGESATSGESGERVTAEALIDLAGDQPVAVVEHGGVRFTLLGTAHVSRASAEAVERMVASGAFGAVAIELDQGRFASITDSQNWQKVDLFKIIRDGKAAMLAVNLALSAFQQRLADQFGIEPGAEMKAAIGAAKAHGLPLLLVDRDIGITLRRVNANLSFWRRLMLISGLMASVLSKEEIDEAEIERLKEGDILEATFNEFAENSELMFVPLITERDQYMVSKLILQSGAGTPAPRHEEVLVVIGAGHLKGVREGLLAGGRVPGFTLQGEELSSGDGTAPPEVEGSAGAAVAATPASDGAIVRKLEELPPPSRWLKAIPWIIVAVLVVGFVIGFSRSPNLGLSLLSDWAIISATLAGLGALVALAHPVTILVAMVASPFTALHPLIGIGPVAAFVQLWLRRPSVGDFESLRNDVTTLRGWWRNRAAHALLVFVLTTIGGATGTWVALGRIFGRLAN